jgi:hypothetical protein
MMCVGKSLCLFVIALLSLSFSLCGVWASDFILKPKLSTTWRVDSNYYKVETGEREIYTYLVQPGIDLGYETAKSLILLNYTLDVYLYDDQDPYPSGAETEDFIGQTLTLKTRTRPTDRLTLGADDSYYDTRDPWQSDVLSNRAVREKYFINRLTPRMEYEFGRKFSAAARYRWTVLDYDPNELEDSEEHRGIFNLLYNFRRRAALDLQYQHWNMEYDQDTSDYTSDQIELSLKKQFHYFSLVAGGGYHERSFDDRDLDDIDTPSYRIELLGQNPPTGGPKKSHLKLSAVQDFSIWHDEGDYHVARRFTLDAGYVFKRKIPLRIVGAYQNSDYERFRGLTPSGNIEKREDDSYGTQGSLGYLIRDWILLSASVGYEERDSNLAGYSYDNNYYMIKLDFAYDVGERYPLRYPF